MTQPILAWTDLETGDRYYQGTDKHDKYLSVTSILGALPKQQYLMPWVAKVTAETAMELFQDWLDDETRDLYDYDYEAWAADLAQVWKIERDTAGELGDEVHSVAERLLNESGGNAKVARGLLDTTEYANVSENGRERLEGLCAWLDAHDVKVVATEFTVYNDEYMYAGTCDIAAVVDGLPTYIDIKTGNDVYPEVALQLAAYSRGEYIRRSLDITENIPFVEDSQSAVLHIQKRQVKYIPIENNAAVFQCFIDVLNVKRHWIDSISKTCVKKAIWRG